MLGILDSHLVSTEPFFLTSCFFLSSDNSHLIPEQTMETTANIVLFRQPVVTTDSIVNIWQTCQCAHDSSKEKKNTIACWLQTKQSLSCN